MRRSSPSHKREVSILFATRLWKNRVIFSKSHPRDERYTSLVGKHAWRPLAREKIPIIADDAIDPEFGTGVLKVTPAHDAVDFEIGQRHNLPVIDVLQPDGRINCPTEPALDGLERFE